MIKLIKGDCLERMADIPDGSVDMVLCDLPYGTTQNKWDSVISLEPLWGEYLRICKPSAAIVLTAQTPFDKVLGCSNLRMLKYEWIWEKTRSTGHLNAKHSPMKNHENVLIFYSELPTYNPQDLVRKAIPTLRKGGDNGSNYGKSDKPTLQEFENYPRTVIKIGSEGKTLHPTQKPVALMEYLIRTYTNEGQTILDNTMGSGTTGVACVNTDRCFIGIERDDEYFKIASNRIDAAAKQKTSLKLQQVAQL